MTDAAAAADDDDDDVDDDDHVHECATLSIRLFQSETSHTGSSRIESVT